MVLSVIHFTFPRSFCARSLAMERLIIALVCVFLLGFGAFGQATRTSRPRIAATPTPSSAAPDIKNDVPASGRRAPVLANDSRIRPQGQTPTPSATPPVSEEDEIVKVETNLVTMPVSVLDREGRFISGLQRRDFKIFENGSEQKVEYFQSVEQPFTVVLLIDVSPSTQFRIDEIQQAAITF